jgi:hypothetical protein
MKFNVKKILPKNPAEINGAKWVRAVTAIYLSVMVGRSAIHLFSADGGANSIAGIDIDVEGGDNIIAIFHQWGAIQLILAVFLLLLLLRYPGFTPLILLTLALDPIMRAVAGQIKPVITEGTPPGESLNWVAFYLLIALFIASIMERGNKK